MTVDNTDRSSEKENSNVLSEDKEVNELKKDIKNREHLKEALKENEILKISAERERKELLDKANASDSTAKIMKDKYALAELKAHAVAAGLSDLDCIKMMDTSSLLVNEDGTVSGISEIVSSFKSAKPYLFGSEKKSSSSTNSPAPTANASKKPDVLALSDEERRVALQDALRNPHKFNI